MWTTALQCHNSSVKILAPRNLKDQLDLFALNILASYFSQYINNTTWQNNKPV
jgi:hypothetical protein